MKPAGKLIVHTTASHFLQSGGEDVLQIFSSVHVGTGALSRLATVHMGTGALTRSAMRSIALILINQQINHCRMRKLRRTSKSAMLRVEHLYSGIHNLLNHRGRELSGLAAE